MSYENFIDVLRLVNAVLAGLAFAGLMYRYRLFYARYSSAQKAMHVSITLFVLATAVSSFEAWSQDLPPGIRTYFVLVANVFMLAAMWRHRDSIILEPAKQDEA